MNDLISFPEIMFCELVQNPHFTIPECMSKWFRIEIHYNATTPEGRGLIDLTEVELYRDNPIYPKHVFNIL